MAQSRPTSSAARTRARSSEGGNCSCEAWKPMRARWGMGRCGPSGTAKEPAGPCPVPAAPTGSAPLPKAIIFDVDGTLVDTVDLHAASWAEALRRFGRDVTHDEVRRQIGKGGDQLMPVFLPPEVVERRGEEIESF